MTVISVLSCNLLDFAPLCSGNFMQFPVYFKTIYLALPTHLNKLHVYNVLLFKVTSALQTSCCKEVDNVVCLLLLMKW